MCHSRKALNAERHLLAFCVRGGGGGLSLAIWISCGCQPIRVQHCECRALVSYSTTRGRLLPPALCPPPGRLARRGPCECRERGAAARALTVSARTARTRWRTCFHRCRTRERGSEGTPGSPPFPDRTATGRGQTHKQDLVWLTFLLTRHNTYL